MIGDADDDVVIEDKDDSENDDNKNGVDVNEVNNTAEDNQDDKARRLVKCRKSSSKVHLLNSTIGNFTDNEGLYSRILKSI